MPNTAKSTNGFVIHFRGDSLLPYLNKPSLYNAQIAKPVLCVEDLATKKFLPQPPGLEEADKNTLRVKDGKGMSRFWHEREIYVNPLFLAADFVLYELDYLHEFFVCPDAAAKLPVEAIVPDMLHTGVTLQLLFQRQNAVYRASLQMPRLMFSALDKLSSRPGGAEIARRMLPLVRDILSRKKSLDPYLIAARGRPIRTRRRQLDALGKNFS